MTGSAGNETTKRSPQHGAEVLPGDSVPWETIAEAGGIHAWVHGELERQGLIDNVDPSTLSAKERKAYKVQRGEERRVRKLLKKAAWASYKASHIVHLGRGVFYHDTVDVDRFDVQEPEVRLDANATPPLRDAQALAKAVDLSIPRLRWLCFSREVDTGCHYHNWTVPKRDGGRRLISAPKPDLKAAQTWVARNITEHLPVHSAAHGFVPGRSTVSNAAVHAGATAVFKFDIRDFYPSITVNRVKGLLRKAGYGEQVATLLAQLCTEFPREEMQLRGKRYFVATGSRALPQGAPTSPSISNALAMRLDCRLAGFARSLGLAYSRYADDLTFSWRGSAEEAPVARIKNAVAKIVTDEGFAIKESKTRILRHGRRQRVTGLVVNGSETGGPARVPRFKMRELRTAIYKLEKGETIRESVEQLRGWAAYVNMTDAKRGQEMLARIAAATGGGAAPRNEETSDE